MYNCSMEVLLVGLEPGMQELFEAVPAEERFTRHFRSADNFDQAGPRVAERPGLLRVIIFKRATEWNMKRLRDFYGAKAKFILCTDESSLAGEELKEIYELWPVLRAENIAAWRFTRLQKRLKAEKDAWLTSYYLERTIDTLPDLVWYKDKIGAHLMVNDAFCDIVRKTKDQIRGRGHMYIWGLTEEEYSKGEYVCLETEEMVMKAGHTCLFDEQVMGPNGMRQLQTYKTPLFDEDGEFMGTVGIARDVTELNRYQKRILDMARTDALTGLANRRYFYHYIAENRKELSLFICYMDLDGFKQFNDTYGHRMGDDVLVCTAKMIQESFPDYFAVRLGGDEFVVVALGGERLEEMKDGCGKLLDKLRTFAASDERYSGLTISIGVSYTTNPRMPIDMLLQKADFAMYTAKSQGKDCYYVLDEKV